MGIANTSEATISLVEESTWGVIPTSPAWQRFRMTGETLTYEKETVTSEEISPNADVIDEIPVGASGSGAINFELSFGDDDTGLILAHALRGSWGAGTANDDLEDLETGLEQKSLASEVLFETGATDHYSWHSGLVVNTLNLAFEERQIVKGSVELIGKGETNGTAAKSGATYAAPNTGRPMAAPNVGSITVAGVSGTVYYKTLSFTLNNNCAARSALGSIDAIGIRYGRREIEINMSAYFDETSAALYALFVAGTPAALSWVATDTAGNEYQFSIPRAVFKTGRRNASANNEDVVAELSCRALYDSTAGYSMRIRRTAVGA